MSSIVWGSNVTAGNLLAIAMINVTASSETISSISDTVGTNYNYPTYGFRYNAASRGEVLAIILRDCGRQWREYDDDHVECRFGSVLLG
jgi:hypothetical protein